MTTEESTLITGLFERLSQASSQARDLEAERLIQAKVSENPHAPYQLAQSTLVLQQALKAAQSRITALENQLAETASQSTGSGSFFSGVSSLFGTPQLAPNRALTPPPIPTSQPITTQSQGGGFLQTAISTAAGVAGGALLFQGIENLLGHNPGPFSGIGGLGGGIGQPAITEVTNNYFDGSSGGNEFGTSGIDPQIAPIDPGVDFTSLNPGFNPDLHNTDDQDSFASNDFADFGQIDDGSFFDGDS